MKYAALIDQALEHANGRASLEELLRHVDAIDKSVPTLEELNTALAVVQKTGRFPNFNLAPVSKEAYDRAVSANWEWMTQQLEKQGMSRQQQKRALETYLKMRKGHDT